MAKPRVHEIASELGVDITANNSADMFTQLRMLLQVERARVMAETLGSNNTRTGFDCSDALYWGTMGGAKALGVPAAQATVFEDATAGVQAGHDGHFGFVVGVDRVGQAEGLRERGADVVVTDLDQLLDVSP